MIITPSPLSPECSGIESGNSASFSASHPFLPQPAQSWHFGIVGQIMQLRGKSSNMTYWSSFSRKIPSPARFPVFFLAVAQPPCKGGFHIKSLKRFFSNLLEYTFYKKVSTRIVNFYYRIYSFPRTRQQYASINNNITSHCSYFPLVDETYSSMNTIVLSLSTGWS